MSMLLFSRTKHVATMILHHGGYFQRYGNGNMEYVGGDFFVWKDYDCDNVNKMILKNKLKSVGKYNTIGNIWWLIPNMGGYVELLEDDDIHDMCTTSIRHNYEVHIYAEHVVDEPIITDEVAEKGEGDDNLKEVEDDNVVEANDVINKGDNVYEDVSSEDFDYWPSYLSEDDESFMDVECDVDEIERDEPRSSRKRGRQNEGISIDLDQNVDQEEVGGMPCEHAVVALAWKHERPGEFCHGWLTMGSYNATYEHFVKPTQGLEYWEKTYFVKLVPAPLRRRPGRPKKQRRKDGSNEGPTNSNKMKRSYPVITCSRFNPRGPRPTPNPIARNATISEEQMLTSFMPTPRFNPRGPWP
ncbi:hypothetical protein TSUD_281380 [Trifolium subterraneum]|uniref:PB1-like domain-containing protein n=1 Tax=Trifolium subterraneum TaxID=3900 RepID=A0A2Z6P3Y4_TRISU|nr:hypothetical protein TSUD_281380 [Trifolium subterraneum]